MTAGAGHRRAAEAIADAVREQAPEAGVECLDVLAYSPGRFRAFYSRSYLLLVRHLPWVWKCSYGLLDNALCYRAVQPLRRWWNLRISQRFIRLLKETQPDAIAVAHFLPADICSAGKQVGWLRAPFVVVITDLHPHRFWISREAETLVVGTPESAAVLRRRGVPEEQIRIWGIPISHRFGAPPERHALLARFRLQPERLTVLVTSGGTTVGQFEHVVASLLALEVPLPGRLQLLVVCGEDAGARARLSACIQTSRMPIQVFGFVDYMAELMGVSDLIVAKAGGLTVSEALGCGVPMVLYHVIPGQEQLNARYVAQHGAGLIAPRPADVARAVRQCVETPARLEAMRAAAQALGHPEAARRIASHVLELARARAAGARRDA